MCVDFHFIFYLHVVNIFYFLFCSKFLYFIVTCLSFQDMLVHLVYLESSFSSWHCTS